MLAWSEVEGCAGKVATEVDGAEGVHTDKEEV